MSGGQCTGTTKNGERCQRYAANGVFCMVHDPSRAAEREAWKQNARAGIRRAWERGRVGLAAETRALLEEPPE